MIITADRARAYAHLYNQCAELTRFRNPIRAQAHLICADMCLHMQYAADYNVSMTLQRIGDKETEHPYTR